MRNPENQPDIERISVNLRVEKPYPDKNFMILFDGNTKKECFAYNNAIEKILKEAKLNPFHQIGVTRKGNNEPGQHAWEIWAQSNEQTLNSLLPLIETAAKMLLGTS
jgi:hypothetical protein